MKRIMAVAAASLLLLTSCSEDSSGEEARGSSSFVSTPISDVPAHDWSAVNDRAYAMGMQLSGDEGGNRVTSPLSLLLALSMLGEGATGEAADQLDEAWGISGDERSRMTAALLTSLGSHEEGFAGFDPEGSPPEKPLLHIANRVVTDHDLEPHSVFLERLSTYHDAPLARANLDSEEGMDFLSAWVSEHTAGLIPATAMEPDSQLRLVLQNAVLFAAPWEQPFTEESEFDADFRLLDGTTIEVPAIHSHREVPYTSSGGWQAIRLNYTEGFTAELVLPPPGTDPSSLSPGKLTELLAGLDGGTTELNLRFPTLDITTTNDLMTDMDELGMTALMDPRTEPLAGIGETDHPLYLGQAVQQATLHVDIEGTKAAAVTEFGVEEILAPAEPITAFIVDRPYLFLVHHKDSGMPVFLAAIRNPGEF